MLVSENFWRNLIIWSVAGAVLILVATLFFRYDKPRTLADGIEFPGSLQSEIFLRTILAAENQPTEDDEAAKLLQTLLDQQLQLKADFLEIFQEAMENRMSFVAKQAEEIEDEEIKKSLEKLAVELGTWFAVLRTSVAPENFATILETPYLAKDALPWMAAIVGGYKPADIGLTKGELGTKTIALGRTGNKLKNAKVKGLTPETLAAYKQLAKSFPDTKKDPAEMLAKLEASPVSLWLQHRIKYQLLQYYQGTEKAAGLTGYVEKENQYLLKFKSISIMVNLIYLLGMAVLVMYFANRKTIGQHPVFFAPTWESFVKRYFLALLVYFSVQILLFYLLSWLQVRMSVVLFVSTIISWGVVFAILFPSLFKDYGIGLRNYLISSDMQLNSVGWLGILRWSIFGYAATNLLKFLAGLFAIKGESPIVESIASNMGEPYAGVFLFATVCLLAPFFEELVFRGYLLAALMKKVSFWSAVFLSGLLFGFMHYDVVNLIPLCVIGMSLAFIRLRSGSIIVTMIIHALINFESLFTVMTISQ